MQKTLAILFAFVLMFAFCACGAPKGDSVDQNASAGDSTETTVKPSYSSTGFFVDEDLYDDYYDEYYEEDLYDNNDESDLDFEDDFIDEDEFDLEDDFIEEDEFDLEDDFTEEA